MFSKLKQKYIDLGLTRYYRIERYLRAIESELHIPSKEEKEKSEEIREIIKEKIKVLKRITWTTFFLYIAIYISFISIFLEDFLILRGLSEVISLVVSIFGTTLFILLAFILNRIAELYYQDLQLLTSHLLSIYNSKGEVLVDDNLEKKMSNYRVLIDFFKK